MGACSNSSNSKRREIKSKNLSNSYNNNANINNIPQNQNNNDSNNITQKQNNNDTNNIPQNQNNNYKNNIPNNNDNNHIGSINDNIETKYKTQIKIDPIETRDFTTSNTNNIFLICPDCLCRSPHIEKLFYDEKSKDILVKYSCICNPNPINSKEISLKKIISNNEPSNLCITHPDKKLINFCKTCRKAICTECKVSAHKGHNIEKVNKSLSKQDADNMLFIIREKEKKFNEEINSNAKKMENGIDDMIQKLNEEKISYKKQMETYKENNLKTFDFLKNLYSRYINIKTDESFTNQDNNVNMNNKDIMINNHISNFAIMNTNIPQINSNIDEIINQYNDEEKELKLSYDYGFNYNPTVSNSENTLRNLRSAALKKKGFNCIKSLKGHNEKIVSLLELSSGKLASGSYDNTIIIWDIYDDKQVKIIKENGHVFCLLEFEKDKLLCGTSENIINLWDINSSDDDCIYSFTGHDLWINSLVKLNNNYFASASNDAKIKIWDYHNMFCLSTLKGHVDCILCLILLKINNNYLCSGSADLTLRIWDWENNMCLSILKGHEKWVKCILELNNGIIVSGSDDKTIKLWKDYNNLQTIEGHIHSVRTLCQINDLYFASGSFDCTIKLWEIDTWRCAQTLYGHESNIICLIKLEYYGNDGYNDNEDDPKKHNFICSCSNDRTIKVCEGNP